MRNLFCFGFNATAITHEQQYTPWVWSSPQGSNLAENFLHSKLVSNTCPSSPPFPSTQIRLSFEASLSPRELASPSPLTVTSWAASAATTVDTIPVVRQKHCGKFYLTERKTLFPASLSASNEKEGIYAKKANKSILFSWLEGHWMTLMKTWTSWLCWSDPLLSTSTSKDEESFT